MDARTPGQIKPEAQAVDWFDQRTPGLALHVTPTGARTWYLFYMSGPTVQRLKLGIWPAMTLGLARDAAQRERRAMETTGVDPRREKQAARAALTVGELFTLFLEQWAKPHKRTWRDDQWRFDRYVRPEWGSSPVRDITRQDVHAVLDKIAATHPIQANRVQMLISKLWNFAIDRGGIVEHNICHRMMKRAPERARATVLDDAALRALWAALDADTGDPSQALRVRLLTGQRGGEVHHMRWADVDLTTRVWTIPASHAKNGQAQRVPLTDTVRRLLEARREIQSRAEPAVFPGLYHQRKDLRALGVIHAGAYRWHDLRRTVATRLAALGIPEETISRVLNHAKRGITATVYNQHAYDGEKRMALEAWDRELQRVVTAASAAPATVVPIRRRLRVTAGVVDLTA